MRLMNVASYGLMLALFLPISIGLAAPQNGSEPHLFFFTSSNCEPCRQVKPEVQRLIENKYPVTTVDVDRNPQLARQFGVDRWPTVILLDDKRVVQRKSGLIDAPTMAAWFTSLARPARQAKVDQVELASSDREQARNSESTQAVQQLRSSFQSSTLHKGTRKPANDAEFNAMRATVRIQVEDPVGVSYATGTVIHCNDGECLVMTCGHVFRESKGKGTISAEYGFESERLKKVPGTLVQYDAGPKDIALIAISTGQDIPPVAIAPVKYPVLRGDQVFSIGCDHGEDATIRRTRIKNEALYDQARKYDIYGRPVDGRSGGGLFTAGGQLIGVCNAAAVEVDEGVYTSLENMYWQLSQANLTHLVRPESAGARQAIASAPAQTPASRELNALQAPFTSEARSQLARSQLARLGSSSVTPESPSPGVRRLQPGFTPVSQTTAAPVPTTIPDTQIIVVFQSKRNPEQAETVVIDQPSEQLLRQLKQESANPGGGVSADFARLRPEMPIVPRPRQRFAEEYRAQSPR